MLIMSREELLKMEEITIKTPHFVSMELRELLKALQHYGEEEKCGCAICSKIDDLCGNEAIDFTEYDGE